MRLSKAHRERLSLLLTMAIVCGNSSILGAAGPYVEHPQVVGCPNDCCVPNRNTFGFYPGTWRRWEDRHRPTSGPSQQPRQPIQLPPSDVPSPLREGGEPEIVRPTSPSDAPPALPESTNPDVDLFPSPRENGSQLPPATPPQTPKVELPEINPIDPRGPLGPGDLPPLFEDPATSQPEETTPGQPAPDGGGFDDLFDSSTQPADPTLSDVAVSVTEHNPLRSAHAVRPNQAASLPVTQNNERPQPAAFHSVSPTDAWPEAATGDVSLFRQAEPPQISQTPVQPALAAGNPLRSSPVIEQVAYIDQIDTAPNFDAAVDRVGSSPVNIAVTQSPVTRNTLARSPITHPHRPSLAESNPLRGNLPVRQVSYLDSPEESRDDIRLAGRDTPPSRNLPEIERPPAEPAQSNPLRP